MSFQCSVVYSQRYPGVYNELYHCVAAVILSAVWAPSQYHTTSFSFRVSHRPGQCAFSSALIISGESVVEVISGTGRPRAFKCS